MTNVHEGQNGGSARADQMVRLPAALHEELKARAQAQDLTLSQALRRAVRAYLAQERTP